MVLGFRGNKFRNPAGLVTWLGKRGGGIKLRPDHKLALIGEMGVAQRLKTARELVGNLNRIALEGVAA